MFCFVVRYLPYASIYWDVMSRNVFRLNGESFTVSDVLNPDGTANEVVNVRNDTKNSVYTVDVVEEMCTAVSCTCPHYRYRQTTCKHMTAATEVLHDRDDVDASGKEVVTDGGREVSACSEYDCEVCGSSSVMYWLNEDIEFVFRCEDCGAEGRKYCDGSFSGRFFDGDVDVADELANVAKEMRTVLLLVHREYPTAEDLPEGVSGEEVCEWVREYLRGGESVEELEWVAREVLCEIDAAEWGGEYKQPVGW